MQDTQIIHGFSMLGHEDKTAVAARFAADPLAFVRTLQDHRHPDSDLQKQYTEFAENAVSNYYLPYCLAPNFLINGKAYVLPMVTEESSVVAAAASAAKFWWPLGGFTTRVSEMLKPGHIHFIWKGEPAALSDFIGRVTGQLNEVVDSHIRSMKNRGGGIRHVRLIDLHDKITGYYQLEVVFDTVDAMGANFVNTCLEKIAIHMRQLAEESGMHDNLDIIMAILSNHTPQCLVECKVECRVQDLHQRMPYMPGEEFARRFELAVNMARHDVSRAVTHNKGIYNGIDAVVIATGNDFRAAEAAGHAWASRSSIYRGLTQVTVSSGIFTCSIEIPLPVGVTGGLTTLHPMARASLQLLGYPGAASLMSIAASAGLASHYSAIRALVTSGIQKGHMKLHLVNLLNRYGADIQEKELAARYFVNRPVNSSAVAAFIANHRNQAQHP